jgi:hypothetical protein
MKTLITMAIDQQTPAARIQAEPAPSRLEGLTGGGTIGNERLTALTGTTLLALLAVIGVTLLQLRQLLWVHLFVGMLLIGPVALKLASTGYRFVAYYTANPSYRRKGAPAIVLRAIAPIVVLSTVVVLASGVALLFAGPSSRDELLPIHKLSFIAWAAFFAIHVLAHLPSIPRALRGDLRRSATWGENVPGRNGRFLSLAGALTAGVVLAVLVIPEFGPWLHSSGLSHHGN